MSSYQSDLFSADLFVKITLILTEWVGQDGVVSGEGEGTTSST